MSDWYTIESETNDPVQEMDEVLPEGSILYLTDSGGIYIPKHFIDGTRPECLHGVSEWAKECLHAGPEAEGYWEAWEDVLNNARVIDLVNGTIYTVYQDGDCWLVPITHATTSVS